MLLSVNRRNSCSMYLVSVVIHIRVPSFQQYHPGTVTGMGPHPPYRLTAKEAFVALFKRLHEFWVSEEVDPQQGSCDKLFVEQESHASASAIAGFVPTGVVVVHKALLTTLTVPRMWRTLWWLARWDPIEAQRQGCTCLSHSSRFFHPETSIYVSEPRINEVHLCGIRKMNKARIAPRQMYRTYVRMVWSIDNHQTDQIRVLFVFVAP